MRNTTQLVLADRLKRIARMRGEVFRRNNRQPEWPAKSLDPGCFVDGRTDHCEVEPFRCADIAIGQTANVETGPEFQLRLPLITAASIDFLHARAGKLDRRKRILTRAFTRLRGIVDREYRQDGIANELENFPAMPSNRRIS